MKNSRNIPVRFIAATPDGDVAVNAEGAKKRLPVDPLAEDAKNGLRYGPYLEAVRHLLLSRNCRRILEALTLRLDRAVSLDEIDFIEIRTEKHGASYNVARADLCVSGSVVSFAANVAASNAAKSEMERDFRLLHKLGQRYPCQFLPEVYFKGAGCYREIGKKPRWLHMFVAEWLNGYHEFHLHLDQQESCNRLLMWDLDRGSRYLSRAQGLELYRQAAKILTAYYDWNSFRQIYPWHHAAGDFVVKEEGGKVEVRLITIRDYGPVVDFNTGKRAGKFLALILFFLHLTIQARLDRLDGVGDVVWADEYCLGGVVAGFFEGLRVGDVKARKGIPPDEEIRGLLRSFAKDDWLQFMQEYLVTYNVSMEESSLIHEQSGAHIDHLQQVLAIFG